MCEIFKRRTRGLYGSGRKRRPDRIFCENGNNDNGIIIFTPLGVIEMEEIQEAVGEVGTSTDFANPTALQGLQALLTDGNE